MFEKEAEEHTKKKVCENCTYRCYIGNILKSNKLDCFAYAREYKTFKDGCKCGYNKANEWHYVKDGVYPKPNVRVDVWVKLNKNFETKYIAYWRPTAKKWQIYNLIEASRQVKDEDFLEKEEVIAWKEIVLPKLKEIE